MFFTVAKLFGYFATLPNVAVFAVGASALLLWTRFRRTARALATASASLLLVCAVTPVPGLLLRPLEDRFPMPAPTQMPTGAIVLGGATDELITKSRGAVTLLDGAERLTEGVALARRYPEMRLVFSGGSGMSGPIVLSEADVARRFWTEMGVPDARMTFEDRSRDTWQNAVFTKAMLQPKAGETWFLVTSAAHMPRAVGIFRKIGFLVVPYPVDYHTTGGRGDFHGMRNAGDDFSMLAIASHEWIGLLAYYLSGRSDALFPGP